MSEMNDAPGQGEANLTSQAVKEKQGAELSDRRKNLDIGWVPYGVTSFGELDQAHDALQKSWDMDTIVWQLHSIIDNIMGSPDVLDKQAKLVELMTEFSQRTSDIISDQQAKEKGGDGPAARFLKSIRRAVSHDDPEPDASNAMTFIKAKDGTYRWVATYSNSFRDDDLFPEIITSKSHKRFVEMVDKGLYPLPELWLWHEKSWKWGEADVVAVDELSDTVVMSVAAGHVDKGKEWIAEALMKTDQILPVSHGMPVSEIVRDKDKSCIIAHQTKEISPLPHTKEANIFTAFYVLKETSDMAITNKKRDDMAKALGVEPGALTGLENLNERLASVATAADTESKAKTAADDAQEDDEDTSGTKDNGTSTAATEPGDTAGDVELKELTPAELGELLSFVVKGVSEGMEAIVKGMAATNARIDKLADAVKAQSTAEKEKATETYATQIYKSILGSAGIDIVANKQKAEESSPADPKNKKKGAGEETVLSQGQLVPKFIQQHVRKSRAELSGNRRFQTFSLPGVNELMNISLEEE